MTERKAQVPTQAAGAWLTEKAPDGVIPEEAMSPIAAARLVQEELAVEGIPERNLATFVTTVMEPEARLSSTRTSTATSSTTPSTR